MKHVGPCVKPFLIANHIHLKLERIIDVNYIHHVTLSQMKNLYLGKWNVDMIILTVSNKTFYDRVVGTSRKFQFMIQNLNLVKLNLVTVLAPLVCGLNFFIHWSLWTKLASRL